MNLTDNWKNSYKAYSVLFPLIGSICILLVEILQKALDLNMLPPEHRNLALILLPILSFIGKIIPQGGQFNTLIQPPLALLQPAKLSLSTAGWEILRQQLFKGVISNDAFKCINMLIEKSQNYGVLQLEQIAYILATAFHETDATMKPIEEYGKGKGKPYGTYTDLDGSHYKGLPHLYYGRGLAQLTWLTNYLKMKRITGVDLVNNPEKALDLDIAIIVIIVGMRDGIFTTRKLETYVNSKKTDYLNARRVVNGTDKAEKIAKYAEIFATALRLSS